MNKWITESSSAPLGEFQKLNDFAYIQRRNIVQLEDGSYTCESRKITSEEYDELIEKRNAYKEEAILKAIVSEFTKSATITAEYQDGYEAAKILLGGDDNV